MTKAAVCTTCTGIVSPSREWGESTDWLWTYCECQHVAVRWRDGHSGQLEVASLHGPEGVRVLGINNMFLEIALGLNRRVAKPTLAEDWRALHEATCKGVEDWYLFHADKRNCWALIVRPGESSDVWLMEYGAAFEHNGPAPKPVKREAKSA